MNTKKRLYNNILPLFLLKGFEYVIPILLVPYLVNVLGSATFGSMSLALSISYLGATITNYGFDLTATRNISIAKGNKKAVSKIFSTVLTAKITLLIICFLIMNLMIFFVSSYQSDWKSYYASFLYVVGSALFPIWLFQGIEKMKYITMLNIIPKIFLTLLIFILVKDKNDIVTAVILQSIPLLISGILGIFVSIKILKVNYKYPNLSEVISCFKDGWSVFISSFMTYILASSGVLVLGLFASREIVGIYSAIEKLIKAIIGLFSPFFQALFPLVSEKFNQNEKKGLDFLVKISSFIMPLTILLTIIIFTFSKLILLLMYGENYIEYKNVLRVFLIWFLLSVLNNFIGIQYLIASGKQKVYSKCFIISATFTLILFFALIPKFNLWGTVLSVVIGELILTVSMVIYIFDYKKRKIMFLDNKVGEKN
ncbi:flippase [Heyndrickxia coagulans]|nr:flippase [Heyndrickxia coagulans]